MTPEQMVAAARASGSPALEALVVGHLAAGRIGMAAIALRLPPEAWPVLDNAFEEAKAEATVLGMLGAMNGDD